MRGVVLSRLQRQDAMLCTPDSVSLGLDSAPAKQYKTKIVDIPLWV